MNEVTVKDIMIAYANDATVFARERFDIQLDFAEKSLDDIEFILTEYTQGKQIDPDSLNEEQQEELWTFCKMIGGYVGEVIVRNIGGSWGSKEIDNNSSSVILKVEGGIEGSPPEAVWRTLTEPYKSIVTYYRSLRVIRGDGQQTTENGIKSVKLPPLSAVPPPKGK